MPTPLPLTELPDLSTSDAIERWRERLMFRMRDVGLFTARHVSEAGGFELGSFDDAFSRLRKGDTAELRRWFVADGGRRARRLANAFEISPGELVDDLRLAVKPPPAPWHPAFPGVDPESVHIPPPIPDVFLEVRGVTPETPLAEAVDAWREKRKPVSGPAKPVILWIEGPPGTGRRTLARALGRLGLGPVVEQPPRSGWYRWLRSVEPPQIAVIDATQRNDAEGRWSTDQKLPDRIVCRRGDWSAKQLSLLIDRLAEVPDGLRGRTLDVARQLVERWRDAPDLLGGVRAPADLIELLGVLRDEPDQAEAPRAAAQYGQWRAIQRRGGDALTPWDAGLLAAFWRCCWLEPAISPWWQPTRAQAEEAMARALSEQARHQLVEDQLDTLAQSGRDRSEKVERLRRTLASRGPGPTLAGLIAADVLTERVQWLRATDPDRARRWVAWGLADRAGESLSGHWERLAEPDWPAIAGELVHAGWTVNQIIASTHDAPDWVRPDVARGLVYAFDASDIDTPSRRERAALRGAWADTTWVQVTGLTQLKSGDRDPAHDAFRASGRVLARVSRRFADVLPRLPGPHFMRALQALTSGAVHAMSDGWHYDIGKMSTRHPISLAVDPVHGDEAAVEVELDIEIARRVPYQCATARVDELPGARLTGEVHGEGRSQGRSLVARRDFIRTLPAMWWDALAERAEGGDPDAIALLSGASAPDWWRLDARDRPWILLVPEEASDDEMRALITAQPHGIRQVIRIPAGAAADWATDTDTDSGIVVDWGGDGQPMVLRLPNDDDRAAPEVSRTVPGALRRAWLAASPDHPDFARRWNRYFDRTSGRFDEMTRHAGPRLVRLLICRALGHPTHPFESAAVVRGRVHRPPLEAPALFTVLRWAVVHRDRSTLEALVELPRTWCQDACLGGRVGAFAVSFPHLPGDTVASQRGDLDWARQARCQRSAPALLAPWQALDDLAHAASVALYGLGWPDPLTRRWTETVFGLSPGWRKRSDFLLAIEPLRNVPWAAVAARLDTLPPEAEAWAKREIEGVGRSHHRGMSSHDAWPIASYVLLDSDWGRQKLPFQSWLMHHRKQSAHTACLCLRELAELLPSWNLGPLAELFYDARVPIAALVVGSLAEVGLPPDVELPPESVMGWLADLMPAPDHTPDLIGYAVSDLMRRRRATAARSLIERGDRRPIARWFQDARSSGTPWPAVRDALLQSRESLGEWLSRLTLDQDMVRTDLLEPAIAWELPQLHTAWLRSTPDTRRRVALKSPDHPQARPWLTALFDEAWEANRYREAALWAWLIHQHHAAGDPRTLRVVEHWALEDSDPFDRHEFLVSNKVLVGGAGALVEMMDSWITHTEWTRRHEAARRLYDARITRWQWDHTSWYTTPTDAEREARRLPWLPSGYHSGIGGLHVAGHIQSWVRAIDATDLRDSALSWDESDFGSTELWALEWWLADADASLLWNQLGELLAGMPGEGQDVLDARLGRIGALLRELGDRDPQRVVDWTLLRCSSVFCSIDLPDNPDWFWVLDHEEAGLDALVEFVALHRPAAVGDIWRDWWSIATTVGRRRWVLRHLAWRATWSGADAARAGALLRQWALER